MCVVASVPNRCIIHNLVMERLKRRTGYFQYTKQADKAEKKKIRGPVSGSEMKFCSTESLKSNGLYVNVRKKRIASKIVAAALFLQNIIKANLNGIIMKQNCSLH